MSKISQRIKKLAPRTTVYRTKEVAIVHKDGSQEIVEREIRTKGLAQPLRQWARDEIARDGKYAELCKQWLENKRVGRGR